MKNKKILNKFLFIGSIALCFSVNSQVIDSLDANLEIKELELPQDSVFQNSPKDSLSCYIYSWGNGASTLSYFNLNNSKLEHQFYLKDWKKRRFIKNRVGIISNFEYSSSIAPGFYSGFVPENSVSPCSKDILIFMNGKLITRIRLERVSCDNRYLPKIPELDLIVELSNVVNSRRETDRPEEK